MEITENNMKCEFLHTAKILNENLNNEPLLFGSLGFEQRLGTDLNADDIDVLIPEIFLMTGGAAFPKLCRKTGTFFMTFTNTLLKKTAFVTSCWS